MGSKGKVGHVPFRVLVDETKRARMQAERGKRNLVETVNRLERDVQECKRQISLLLQGGG
jgi:hypothetical protein